MKSINPNALEKLIAKKKTIILQIGSNRCLPCRQQEIEYDSACKIMPSGKIECVKIDIDDYPKILKDLNLKTAIPAIVVYKEGVMQPIIDTARKNQNVDYAIYGFRRERAEKLVKKLIL